MSGPAKRFAEVNGVRLQTQLTVLTLFILLTIVAVRKFRSEPIVRA